VDIVSPLVYCSVRAFIFVFLLAEKGRPFVMRLALI